ncbi:phage tail family protein [Bacillus spizizenii]|nr:phage tail family protein [Bacillus spizizenii]
MLDLYIDFNDGKGERELTSLLPRFSIRSFTPDSPNIERETTTMSRINGLVLPQHPRDVVYKERSIKVEFLLDSIIAETFYQNRHELYALLVQPFPYYISTDLFPNRRFLVTCDGNFSIPKDKQKNHATFTVEFTDILGLAESKYTSSTLQNFNGEHWSSGMGILMRDDLEYHFKNKKRFSIYNPGDAIVNTLQHNYNVTFWAKGKNVTIVNHTNGEKLKIEQELQRSQKVTFIKQYTVINDKRIKTSGRLPSLDIGWNEFEIQNSNDFEIKFDTHFYYK